MDALLLFSHGSVLCGAGAALELHVERLRADGAFPLVAIGYLNYSEPLFAEAVAALAAAGATRITVVPYLLSTGFFVRKMQDETRAQQARFPQISFVFGAPLIEREQLADALLAAADAAAPPECWDDPLNQARAHCRRVATCPLYESCRGR